jgi:hypothetical protein
MLSGSFPIFALSNHTTFSQTQTGATVPLKSWLILMQKMVEAVTVGLVMNNK